MGGWDSSGLCPSLVWGPFLPNLLLPLPAGRIPGPGFLLHLWFLWSCTAGCPHFVSFRRALVSPVKSPVSPTLFPAPSHHVFILNTPCSYLMVSSVVGFYSSPLFTRLLPERQDTPLTKVGAAGRGWGTPVGCKTLFPTMCPCALLVVSSRGRTVSHCQAGLPSGPLEFGKPLARLRVPLQQHCPHPNLLLLPRSSGTVSPCWCSAQHCLSSPGHWVSLPEGSG